jgi:glycosyltransferase involved in cell wall biosynthesis
MRVLHVLEALEGGTSRHVRALVEAQVAAGHDAAVVMPSIRVWGQTDAALAVRMEELGVAVFRVRMHRLGPHPINVAAMVSVGRIIRRWRPSVVHTHSAAAGVIGRPVARALGVPTVHTPHGVRFADVDATAVGRLAKTVERAMAPFTTRVIGVSDSEGAVLRGAYPARKVAIVPNGMDGVDDMQARAGSPDAPAMFRVVSVCRLVYQKDPELLVRVLAEFRRRRPEAEAVIVGYGDLEPAVRELIAQLDPAITISQEAGVDAIASASVLLLASRGEGAPYVMLEAMALGRPVVATDVVGSRDIVADGQTGLLFPWNDPVAGAEKLVELFDDPTKLAAMGRAGRARLDQKFSLAGMAAAIDRVYAAAIGAS